MEREASHWLKINSTSKMFVSTGEKQSFANTVLIMPSISIGSVGQLTMDLLINSLSLKHIGWLDDANVLPVVGNDAYGSPTRTQKGTLALNLEVFQGEKFTLLQQRAPFCQGGAKKYAENLLKWIQESQFLYVVIVSGSDVRLAMENQLADRLVFSCSATLPDAIQKKAESLLKTVDKKENGELMVRGTGIAKMMCGRCQQLDVPFLALFLFTTDGDNLMDGVTMANLLHTLLQFSVEDGFSWVPPPSWSNLFGPGIRDDELYF
eukprot:Lithocolla_globosa_v1_NODE_3811_length_1574_cov_5.762344.p1 type:complete len:264 gc:universal NODE_3811_length_1574_cov_5.762344:1415-624(-)